MKRIFLPVVAILGSATAPLAAMAILPFFVAFTWALAAGAGVTGFQAWRLYRARGRNTEA
jgi:hypothetical protein